MMNERIRKLAEQAEGTKKHVPAVWQFYDHELEKFAELILTEVIATIYRTDVSDRKQEQLVSELAHKFGFD